MALRCIDMTGREINLGSSPRRIVSVVPSQTELLYDLGLDQEVCGITRFCIHPQEWFRDKQRVGGTKQLHLDKIIALKPELIIANKEENTREQITALAELFPVWISDISNLDQALYMITELGHITGRQDKAHALRHGISAGFQELQAFPARSCAYLIWRDPWMTVGNDTFIHDMLNRCNLTNVYADCTRYPATGIDELQRRNPELVLLSSEPYPFKEQHIAEVRAVLPAADIRLVDGELFSWYGSRLRHTPAYFRQLFGGN
jgi:ABC-type Fe3+-hydroxamate transport system substrate-binding protein